MLLHGGLKQLNFGNMFTQIFTVAGCFFKKIYLFEREREWDRGAERGGENPQADSSLSMEPDMGLDPRTLRS